MVGRALRRKCPLCGVRVFDGWFRMKEVCPRCGHRFERESGYWVGAITINTTVTFMSFVGLFLILTLVNWPDVPWGMVMGVTVAVNVIFPIVFYPISKTLWSALELSWHPLEADEVNEMEARASGSG